MIGGIVAGLHHAMHRANQTITRQQSLRTIQKQYPQLYKVLSQLKSYLETNPSILNQLSVDSGVSQMEILKMMDIKSTEGQVIMLKKFSNREYGESGYSSKHGHVSYLSKTWVQGLEIASLPTTIQATSFVIAITTLHEFVHWGRASLILPSNGPQGQDYGNFWEQNTFGTTINKSNTYEMSVKFKWKF